MTDYLATVVDFDSTAEHLGDLIGCKEGAVVTIDSVVELVNVALGSYVRHREALARDGKRTQPATDAAVARIVGIVTGGTVQRDPADPTIPARVPPPALKQAAAAEVAQAQEGGMYAETHVGIVTALPAAETP